MSDALGRAVSTRSPDEPEVDGVAGIEMENLVRGQLELLGEDPRRVGLLKTPERVAKALAWLTRGYEIDEPTWSATR